VPVASVVGAAIALALATLAAIDGRVGPALVLAALGVVVVARTVLDTGNALAVLASAVDAGRSDP
jgi:hypothetical protein